MSELSLEEKKIILEEESNLAHLQYQSLSQDSQDQNSVLINQIYELRDSLGDANSDDVPQITEQISRISAILYRSREQLQALNLSSPYFGHMKLEEGKKVKDFYLGSTVFNTKDRKIQIVDWRTSPISVIFYRYQEEEEYEEEIGRRVMEGLLLSKRTLTIIDSKLYRVQFGSTTLTRDENDSWKKLEINPISLKGGTGKAVRATNQAFFKPELGVGKDGGVRKDKHLPEISALLDPSQYDLITRPSSGIVAIQGTAGSGKTTVALHRVAWLHHQNKSKFAPHKILVMVFSKALASYIKQLLPSLGVEGVRIEVYEDWSSKLRKRHLRDLLPEKYTNATPASAIKVKKHPALIKIIQEFCESRELSFHKNLKQSLSGNIYDQIPWKRIQEHGFLTQLKMLFEWINLRKYEIPMKFPGNVSDQKNLEREIIEHYNPELSLGENLIVYWEEIFSDFKDLKSKLVDYTDFSEETIDEAIWWNRQLYMQRMEVLYENKITKAMADSDKLRQSYRNEMESDFKLEESDNHYMKSPGEDFESLGNRQPEKAKKNKKSKKNKFGDAVLDLEDDPILLYFYKELISPFHTKDKQSLSYNHIVIDEAQDLSPLDLKNIISTAGENKSITIAGDVHQKLIQYNGFEDWNQVFKDIDIENQKISPLQVSYRSTYEIMNFAMEILGDLAKKDDVKAQKHGAPVELFQFRFQGEMTSWLSDSLKNLIFSEPHASVAIICADLDSAKQYYQILEKFEIPKLRLVADQDFSFTAGIDITDVKQVKGLEFDYVILTDVDTVNYPDNEYSKFLLHIAATRAAHQLWMMNYRKASLILPEWIIEDSRNY